MTVNHVRIRLNVFNTTRGLSIAVRLLPGTVPTLERLNLHPSIERIGLLKSGLVLICGTTGCGKSTTIAAIINEINRNRAAHIVTLEDPIEYNFLSNKSFIEQRELGTHILSFEQGLLDVLREDPDVIVVGEMREPEIIGLTLNAAESGHLVIASLHATHAEDAIYRIVNAFPPGIQEGIRFQLASTLSWVVIQHLIYLDRVKFRVPLLSILKGTQATKGIIRENRLPQIESVMHTGKNDEMYTTERYLTEYLGPRLSFVSPSESFMPSEEFIPEKTCVSALIDLNASLGILNTPSFKIDTSFKPSVDQTIPPKPRKIPPSDEVFADIEGHYVIEEDANIEEVVAQMNGGNGDTYN
jgi:twitching motility protein PilT